MINKQEIKSTPNVDNIANSKVFLSTIILGAVSAFISYALCNGAVWEIYYRLNIFPWDMINIVIWGSTILLTPIISYLLLGILLVLAAVVMRIITKYGKVKT